LAWRFPNVAGGSDLSALDAAEESAEFNATKRFVVEGNGNAERVGLTRRRGVVERSKVKTNAETAEGVVSLRTERESFRRQEHQLDSLDCGAI
jgi:hypothetical protein